MIRAVILPINRPTYAGRVYPQEIVDKIISTARAATRRHVCYDNNVRGTEIKLETVAGIVERMEVEGDELIAYYHTLETPAGVELASLVACGFPILYTPVCAGTLSRVNVVTDANYHFLNAYFKGEG